MVMKEGRKKRDGTRENKGNYEDTGGRMDYEKGKRKIRGKVRKII